MMTFDSLEFINNWCQFNKSTDVYVLLAVARKKFNPLTNSQEVVFREVMLGAEIAEQWLRAYKFSNVDREFIVDSITNHLSEDCWLRKYDNLGKHNEEVQN